MTQLLTTDEVAAWLRIPPGTLYQWRHRRVGPVAIRVGKHLRYDSTDVQAWLDEQRGVELRAGVRHGAR
jgi:excisionase family DNA binding protein